MSQQRLKQALILMGFAALVGLGSMFSPPALDTNIASATPTAQACRPDWTKCTDNAEMVNNYKGWLDAQIDCKLDANNRARYGTPEWPFFSSFGYFQPGTSYKTGLVTLIEPNAKFQNGFGAMAHSRVTCIYDLRTKKVISVDISMI